MEFRDFDTNKINEYAQQAKESWGNTAAYKEFEKKNKGRNAEDQMVIAEKMLDIFAEFAKIKDQSPASAEAQELAKKLQGFITANFYHCTDEIFAGLGKGYGAGGEFTKNINDAAGEGTAEFASKAIEHYVGKQ